MIGAEKPHCLLSSIFSQGLSLPKTGSLWYSQCSWTYQRPWECFGKENCLTLFNLGFSQLICLPNPFFHETSINLLRTTHWGIVLWSMQIFFCWESRAKEKLVRGSVDLWVFSVDLLSHQNGVRKLPEIQAWPGNWGQWPFCVGSAGEGCWGFWSKTACYLGFLPTLHVPVKPWSNPSPGSFLYSTLASCPCFPICITNAHNTEFLQF